MLEQHYDYGKPFYEFFKIIKLKGFTKEESIAFLRSIGKGKQKERMEEIIRTNPARIETLRQLTGGVPRTLVMLFDIFLDEGGNAFDDLLKVLDEATPLYKHRIDELPNQLQEIVHTIAINWDGMYTAEIAKKTRLSTKVISAQLGKLEKYDIIESEVAGKNKIYKIKERFFNIWYLMRFGRKKDRQRVEWLVRFLESWCTKEELDERAENLIYKIKDGDVSESYVFHMTEALSGTGKLDANLEDILMKATRLFLKFNDSNYASSLSLSSLETYYDGILGVIDFFYEVKERNLSFKHISKGLKSSSSYMFAFYYLIYDNFKESWNLLEEWGQKNHVLFKIIMNEYSTHLLAKGQYYFLKNILEEDNLQEQFKPIWYALMTLMQDEFPHEIKKMGSELQESVDEVLKKVEEYRVKYGD